MAPWRSEEYLVGGVRMAGIVRRLATVLGAVALALLVMCFFGKQDHFSETADQGPGKVPQGRPAMADTGVEVSRPSILFIMTDDMDVRSMEYFPELQREIGAGSGLGAGATFQNSYVTQSLCCPSRTSMLTGMYSHNHQVRGNGATFGGLEDLRKHGHERVNIATRLDDGGYRTVFIGKYLNDYAGGYVPKGWDRWYGYRGGYNGKNMSFQENDRVVRYNPDRRFDTYVMRDMAIKEIQDSGDKPFFMWLSFHSPHSPSLYPEKYANYFPDTNIQRVPSMGEKDLSDKPKWVRKNAGYTPDDEKQRRRLRSMLAVSESVTEIMTALAQTGRLANTYVVFTSDNGLRLGEHDIPRGKKTAYEEDVSVPLYMRGPGVPTGVVYPNIALNTDLAPTFADWANIEQPPGVDGRSLAPIFDDPGVPWRTAFLIEHWRDRRADSPYIPTFKAVHTNDAVYIRYATGEHELYKLDQDPYELSGKVQDPALENDLEKRLAELRNCAEQACREAEDGR
ncbi:MAG: sulfatase [Rubrobacter sp.]|nr:sulfatase [Rubrobacter sp.]